MADIVSLLQSVNLALGGSAPPRVPIQWQSDIRRRAGKPPLLMKINPTQVQFQQNKRIQKQDTIGGSVYFHFSNENGQNNDILMVNLSGTTGNIDPRTIRSKTTAPFVLLGDRKIDPADLVPDRTSAVDKLTAWASFYELTLEPIVDLETGKPNRVTMTYASPLFRKPIQMIGFFNNVLQFSETAAEPFQRQWSVQFVVQRTEPRMDKIGEYLSSVMVRQI